METREQVASVWQRKLEHRVSFCLGLIVSILTAVVIGMVITLLVWATLG